MSGPIAVVGASGFVGNRLVETLHLAGEPVIPIVRRIAALALSARFRLDGRIADGLDTEALTRAFEGCDTVVHALAGDPATITGAIEPAYRAATAAGVRRLVYLSSASVHGQSPAPGTTEASALSDRQPLAYNNAKVQAERRLLELRAPGPVEVVILRPGIVHGPRSFWSGGFATAVTEGRAALVGGGRGICNAVYVDNLVHAIRLAIAAPAAGVDREAFIVGDAETITWADLCGPIAAALGTSVEALAVPQPTGADRQAARRADLMRLGLKLGLSPFPARVRRAVRTGLDAYRGKTAVTAVGPEITDELVALHTCQVRLPFDKATARLGYHPPVPFTEAMRRTLAWLDFAGYSLTPDAQPGTAFPGLPERPKDTER
jgi:nucleoside-diphosphate-sugar epimerase